MGVEAPVLSAFNQMRGTSLGSSIRPAASFRARLLGLHAKRPLRAGGGVWLSPCRAIQTIGMREPIDAVFLDARGRVVRLYPHLRPGRMIWWVPGARSVLELPAGTIERSRTRIGDIVDIVDVGARGQA